MCTNGDIALASMAWPGKKVRERYDLSDSYVTKKIDAPGALPTATLPMPRYTPVKPPAFQKPWALCSRVLMVSMG